LAAAALTAMGAQLIKVEPPTGDPFSSFCPQWYSELILNQQVIKLDLKSASDHEKLLILLENCDLLITSSRPSSLGRLGVSWSILSGINQTLCMVSVIGYPAPDDDRPGHDLTYQAQTGLIDPPRMPRTLLADILGAERLVQFALGLLFHRARTGKAGYKEVILSEAAQEYEKPLNYNLTTPNGPLGGTQPRYNIYQTQQGWVALAALEEKYWQKLLSALQIDNKTTSSEYLQTIFLSRSAKAWKTWANEHDIPLAEIQDKR